MKNATKQLGNTASRRSFLRKGLAVGGAGAIGVGLLANGLPAFAHDGNGRLTKGDAAILRFLAALETLESDLWLQYNELGGIHPDPENEFPQGSGNPAYTAALVKLDEDMPQYIHDNTDDEFSHFEFINAYLVSKGAEPANLERFRTLHGSQATGADKNALRLTNLMQLTVDTSYWTRYRSDSKNPDLDPDFVFPQAVPSLDTGQHPAIPRTDADTNDPNQIQSIANTAAFHFGFIEQGGTSLYPALAQRVHNVEVLRILLSIGPSETMHFQVWHDKAGAAVSPPLAPLTFDALQFLDLTSAGPDFQPNLIMPEPTFFLNRTFPKVSIIRPTETKGAAKGAVTALTNDGLFIGQSDDFFKFLNNLADEADEAQRRCK